MQGWTTADFDQMCWHDCHVHGFQIGDQNEQTGTASLELDIDYIVEWIQHDDRNFEFRVAPATLTFQEVSGLRFVLDFVTPSAGMCPFSIAGIDREPLTYPTGYTSYRWQLAISWPSGSITFDSPGFTQALRKAPVVISQQSLSAEERASH